MATYDPEKLCPAPLNQKDIMEDALFEQLFDYLPGYVEDNHVVLGFIDKHPVAILWRFNSNVIRIWPVVEIDNVGEAKKAIIKRLEEMNGYGDCQTCCKIEILQTSVKVSFYYQNED